MAELPPKEVTPEVVQTALGKVEDPATGRPIRQSGQLGEVQVDGERIAVDVALISPGYPLKGELDKRLREAAEDFPRRLEITWSLQVPRKPPRQDLDRMPTVKHVLAVAAGKGGVGKSTVSTNLALALQQLGASVGLLDADIYGPSAPKMLGKPTRACDRSTEGDRILPAIHRGMPVMSVDFFVETGRAVIWRGPMIHKLLQQFLEDVEWGNLDYLVVDLPPGTGDAQLSLGQLIPINGAVLVTTPQEVALLDVRKAANMLEKLEIPMLGIVENMSHYECPACGHRDHLFDKGGGSRLAEELALPLLGQLPLHPSVSRGGETGQPVLLTNPDGAHAKTFLDAAANVALELSRKAATGPRRSTKLRTV